MKLIIDIEGVKNVDIASHCGSTVIKLKQQRGNEIELWLDSKDFNMIYEAIKEQIKPIKNIA